MRIIWKGSIVAAVLVMLANGVFAVPSKTFQFDHLGIEEGLSQSSVPFVLQDRAGFMWFVTDDGLNRYDGYRFKVFRHELGNDRSLAAGVIFNIHEDNQGVLWVIAKNGISRYNRDKEDFDLIPVPKPVRAERRAVVADWSNHQLLFNSNERMYSLDTRTNALREFKLPNTQHPLLMGQFGAQKIIYTDGSQLYITSQGTVAQHLALPPDMVSGVDCVLPVPATGELWIFGKHKVCHIDVTAQRVLQRIDLQEEGVTCAAFDEEGRLFAGTPTGLLCIDTARGDVLSLHASKGLHGLTGNFILDLFRDRNGILWIGTNEGGLSKLSGHKFKFGSIDGLSGRTAVSLAEDSAGRIWIGTENGSISIYNPATATLQHCNRSMGCHLGTESYVLSMMCRDGIMYCGHDNGIDAISIGNRTIISRPLAEKNAWIKRLLCDASGGLWALGARWLYHYNPPHKVFERVENSDGYGWMHNIVESSPGTFWIGTGNTLLRYRPSDSSLLDYSARFPQFFGNAMNMAICKDAGGRLWIAASAVGLLRYDEETDSFRYFSIPELPNKEFYALCYGASGGLWLSTNAGLSSVIPLAGKCVNYSTSDGLRSNEGMGRAMLYDSRGWIWSGNTEGVNYIDPAHISRNRVPPVPRITGFKVFDKDVPFDHLLESGIHLPQGDNYFTMEYAAMDYTQPAENSYRIMLEGFDKDWRPRSKSNSVSYTNLDGGHYRFKLIAYNSDGVPSKTPLVVPIYIAPHFYRTWWFYLAVIILVAGSAYLFYRYRINELKKELRLRHAIASDLHDDVGATLSSIKMLTTMLRPRLRAEVAEIGEAVDVIHHRAGSTLEAMSDIVWSINPKNDAGEHLLLRMKSYAAELLGDSDTAYDFHIAEGLERLKFRQHERKEVYLIYKEALNNALKYATASRIDISVRKEGARLMIEVADNGVGFNPEREETRTSGGNGLKNMQARAEKIGGSLSVQSSIGKGTIVTLNMPIPHSR